MMNTKTDEPNKLSKTENTHTHKSKQQKTSYNYTYTNNEIQHQHHKVIKHILIVTPPKVNLILLVVP